MEKVIPAEVAPISPGADPVPMIATALSPGAVLRVKPAGAMPLPRPALVLLPLPHPVRSARQLDVGPGASTRTGSRRSALLEAVFSGSRSVAAGGSVPSSGPSSAPVASGSRPVPGSPSVRSILGSLRATRTVAVPGALPVSGRLPVAAAPSIPARLAIASGFLITILSLPLLRVIRRPVRAPVLRGASRRRADGQEQRDQARNRMSSHWHYLAGFQGCRIAGP